MTHVPRYVKAETNGGWGIVGLVTALTVVLIIAVTVIYQRTHKPATDPTFHAVGGAKSHTAAPAAH